MDRVYARPSYWTLLKLANAGAGEDGSDERALAVGLLEARRRFAEREELRARVIADARRAIRRRAPDVASLRAAYLFGSVTRPGRFGAGSDVDVAVACDDPADETRLWRLLEDERGRLADP